MIKMKKRLLSRTVVGMTASLALIATGCTKERPDEKGAGDTSSESVIESAAEDTGSESAVESTAEDASSESVIESTTEDTIPESTAEDITQSSTEIETEALTEPETSADETVAGETETESEPAEPTSDISDGTSVISTSDYTLSICIDKENTGLAWKYFAANKTDKSITFELYDFYKNGSKLDWLDNCDIELEPGESSEGIILNSEDSSYLSFGNYVECTYLVNGLESGNRLFYDMNTEDLIRYPEEPVVLSYPYNTDELSIAMIYNSEDVIEQGTEMTSIDLFIGNNTDSEMAYNIKDLMINGIHFSMDSSTNGTFIEPRQTGVMAEILIPNIELERLGIEKIEEVQLKIEVYDENISYLIDRIYIASYPNEEEGKHFEEIKSSRVPDNVIDNELFRFEVFKDKNEYGDDVFKYRFENKSNLLLVVPIDDFEINGKMIHRSLDWGRIYADGKQVVEGTLDILNNLDIPVSEIKTLSFEPCVISNNASIFISRGRLGDNVIVLQDI